MHIMYRPVSPYKCRSRCVDFLGLGSIFVCVVSCYLHTQLQTSLVVPGRYLDFGIDSIPSTIPKSIDSIPSTRQTVLIVLYANMF